MLAIGYPVKCTNKAYKTACKAMFTYQIDQLIKNQAT